MQLRYTPRSAAEPLIVLLRFTGTEVKRAPTLVGGLISV
jgi:hypothetical protein